MSIWKSPIFYFGIALVLIVAAALLAPFIVNWNGYRDNLETYGRRLTGRDVAISGQISARLFPWPRLVLEDVSVGNPAGFPAVAMLNAKAITAQLNLAGLMAGEIRVESIDINQPKVRLLRRDGGSVNWIFEPDHAVRSSKLLDQVKLEQINVIDGMLSLTDTTRGFNQTLTQFNSAISAPALEGPWRLRGTAKQGELPLTVSFTSSEYKAGEAFKFGLRIEPQDGSLPAFGFDGAYEHGGLKGKVLAEPVVTVDGKQSLEGSLKPLKYQADVSANFDAITLDKIQITPADSKDNGTLIEGSANFAFAAGVKADVKLSAPRLDLDTLAGSQSLRVWRAGGIMAVLNGVMKDFPETLDLSASLDVQSLSAVGETLENLSLKASAEHNAIRIKDFTANLPGRSRMKFGGLIFPGEVAAELGGSLAFESNDSRAFASWLWPEGKSALNGIWTGSRGRLKAQTDVTWSGKRFGFQNLQYELDGEGGVAQLAVRLGKLAAVDLQLDAKMLDLDRYMSGGLLRLWQGSGFASALQSDGGLEKRLSVNAKTLRVNGVEAQEVGMEFNSSLSGFEIKRLDIGSVEGASLHGQGLVLQSPDGPSGEVKANLKADNPRGFLRLLGATGKGVDPAWTNVLGATDMQAMFSIKPGAVEPHVSYNVSGTTGPLRVSLSGEVSELSKGNDATIGVSSEINAESSADIARLFGLRIADATGTAGKLVVTAAGSRGVGYKTNAYAVVFGARLGFEGQYNLGKALPELNGELSLDAADGAVLNQAIGLPMINGGAGPIAIKTKVVPGEGGLNFTDMKGAFASQQLNGTLQISAAGKLSADLNLDQLDLREILAAAFLPWTGKLNGADEAFSASRPSYDSEVWLHPAILKTGIGADLKEAVLGLSFDQDGRQATVAARDVSTEPFKLDLSVKPQGDVFVVSGSAHIPIELRRIMRLTDGNEVALGLAIVDGQFNGKGRSPVSALANFEGKATYELHDAKLTRLSPAEFFARVGSAKNMTELQSVFAAVFRPPGVELSAQQLAVTVQNGTLHFEPLTLSAPAANLTISPVFDFTSGEFEANIEVGSTINKELPTLKVSYAGLPGALRQRSDTTAIASKLGVEFMAKDLAELERVQKEQARIAAEELAQQKLDEEKFAAFQAQRNELRLRLREQRVFAAQRILDVERQKAALAKAIKDGTAMNAAEVKKFVRELSVAP